jgi:hypothetical protein
MAISTNSIIHYTDTFNKLESILKEGFAIKYCSEKLKVDGGIGSQAAHPMISFCDIPLSQSYKHFDAYGKYGIGLSKEWAYQMGINPVLYLEEKSIISKTISSLLEDRRSTSSNLNELQRSNILKIKSFTKNYSGLLKRKNIDDPNYKFYDEREWRLVPEREDIENAPLSINLTIFTKSKDTYNKAISSIRFAFKPADVSYIIVDKTEEISEIINLLRLEFYEKYTQKEMDMLFSKIVSTEQILSDY